jgi:thioredoxin-related protein
MIKKYLLLMILLVSLTLIGCSSNENIDLETFATCLTEKGAQLFGSQTCPHCQHQKEMFNDAFEHIDYTECSINREKCSQEEIKYLPTWKFADGSEVSGVQEFKELSEKTGCALN